MGGSSPILKNTQDQAKALEEKLNAEEKNHYKTFIAMRYWHPFAKQTAREVKAFAPDEIFLLPLYPQFSTTTTGSSLKNWERTARKEGIQVPVKTLCCDQGFIRALAQSVRSSYLEAQKYGKPRVLFSAHGLPEKIIKAGDPYQDQCEKTVAALRRELKIENLDSVLCFQSRVGPMKWITPSTEDEVCRAGKEKAPLIIAPIAFVSDHSETLVEIDKEYRALAQKTGVPFFVSVRPVGVAADFIEGLARLVQAGEKTCVCGKGICSDVV